MGLLSKDTMHTIRLLPSVLFAIGAFCLQISSAQQLPPVAEIRNVPTILHGSTVNDPYRWMEDTKSAQSQAWFKGQGDASRSILDRIEGRDALAARLAQLADSRGDAFSSITRMPGDRYFYLKRKPGERQYKLYMRRGLAGVETILVDPETETKRTGIPHAINYFKPSWDCKYLAYGMSAGGSENASLFVLDVANNKLLGAPVPRVHDTALHWLPDSRSLSFTQLAALKPGAPDTETYLDASVMLLRIGASTAQPVFGPTVTRNLGLERLDVSELITAPSSPWVVARTTDTTVPEGKLFVAALAQLGRSDVKWRRISTAADKIVAVGLQGNSLYLMTQAATPRRKVVRVDLKHPLLAKAELVVAQPTYGVLEGFKLTPTGLITTVRQGTQLVLRRHERNDTTGHALNAPVTGSAWLTASPANDTDKLIYSLSGWTEPARWYQLEGERSVEVHWGERTPYPNLPEITVSEVVVPSHDGVGVPMTILHRKGLVLDGSNPVLLNGYASYGFSISASFSNQTITWIERGGVAAFANPRGSGVYGDDWHRAGFKTTKSNTWKDGIACARYLIAKGYGSPATMGITGGSAGGIFVGRAVTEAPELFSAAIFNVGLLDTVRAEESANGITNISEFGTVRNADEFKALLEMSTYHAIRDSIAYPGVLLVHGMNDPRVDVWQSGKTAARLQAAQVGTPNVRPTLLRLDMQAGHGIGSTQQQRQSMAADIQSFLLWQMGKAALRD